MSLPEGFGIALDPGVRRIDGGVVLVGGAPLRLLRLTPAGSQLVDRWAAGSPVASEGGPQRLARRLLDAGMAHPRPDPASVTFSAADVAVVIPVRDRADELAATIATLGPVARVVVVDDGSRIPIPGALRHDTSRGPGAARNTGWQAVDDPLVAFVDADCMVEPGWLEGLLKHFADPAVVAVAPRIVARGGSGAVGAFETVRCSLDRGPAEAPVRPRGRVPFVPTAVFVVRRSALEEVAGFDETMRFGEDVDLVWRLVARGDVVRYEPAVRVTHPVRPTLRAWLRQRFEYGTSAAPLARRHGRAVAPLAVSFWSAAAWTLAGLGWVGPGAAVAGGTSALLAPRLRGLEHPWREAAKLAGGGHLYAGDQVADAVRRVWWPLALAAAVLSRRARRGVLAAAVVPPMIEWARAKPPLGPLRWLGLRLADDVAYGAGVWVGCGRERRADALMPDLSNWPGRRQAVESLSPPG